MDCKLIRQGCGGCTGFADSYEQHLRKKQDAVKRLLGKYGTVRPIVGADDPLHYRCKVIASFGTGRDGKLIAGLYAKGSHRILQGTDCLLENGQAAAAVDAVRQCAAACRLQAYDEDRGTGLLRHVLVRCGAATGQLMIVLVTAQSVLPGARNFVARLRQSCPNVTTIVQNINSKNTSAVLGPINKTLWGPGYIEDALCGCRFIISPASFYQVNPAQTEKLYRLAMQAAQLTDGCTVLDAYCGTGTIGLVAAKYGAGAVVGVENNRDAVQDAIRNARRNGIVNARFTAADAGRFLQQIAQTPDAQAPDVVFMDPPRAGSDLPFLRALLAVAPRRIVYISCNPETQARDLRTLIEGGYHIDFIQPVDLFPFTEHTECVVGLWRETAKKSNFDIRTAQQDDAKHILSLYQSAKSGAFCVWNDSYPTMLEIKHDLETNNLYVMTHNGKIIGAISIVAENELDHCDCWSCKDSKEIARVVICKDHQGKGLSFEMVKFIESCLRKNGCRAIHLSVAKSNIPAYKIYVKAGFKTVGDAEMYENSYYLMEKILAANSQSKQA